MKLSTPRRKNTDCLRAIWEAVKLFPWHNRDALVTLTGFPVGTVNGRLSELEELGMLKSTLRPGVGPTGKTRNMRHYCCLGEVYVHPTKQQRYAAREARQVELAQPGAAELFNAPEGTRPDKEPVRTNVVTPPCPPPPAAMSINLADLDVNSIPFGLALELYKKLHNALESVRAH
jgi:hypothetical protein